jgi:hypothetical protein
MDGHGWMDVDGCRFVINNPFYMSIAVQCISTVGRYGIWASLAQHTAFLRDTATREYGRIACERRGRERERESM